MTSILLPAVPASATRYDISRSYEWNYINAPPLPHDYLLLPASQAWKLCGVDVNSPIGIAAGPLLNGRWVLHYAALGYDVLTYKTVRSKAWPCYPQPNLQPIRGVAVSRPPTHPLTATETMSGSWAVSFGMPSKSPDLWRFDVEETRRLLPRQKRLSVSVVATPDATWTIDQVAEDYANCAHWAIESGADLVELNFSCPNVATRDGQLYQNADQAKLVTQCVRARIGDAPLLIKIGQIRDRAQIKTFVNALSGLADALVMINCIPAAVCDKGRILFNGHRRGIAGSAIRDAMFQQVTQFSSVISDQNSDLEVIGVGGLATVGEIEECLSKGELPACSWLPVQ